MDTDKIRELLNQVNLKSREDEIFEDFDLLSDAIFQLDVLEAMIKNGKIKVL